MRKFTGSWITAHYLNEGRDDMDECVPRDEGVPDCKHRRRRRRGIISLSKLMGSRGWVVVLRVQAEVIDLLDC